MTAYGLKPNSWHDANFVITGGTCLLCFYRCPCGHFNTLGWRQNSRHLADIFKCTFLNENQYFIKFVHKIRANNIPALFKVMSWRGQATRHYLNHWWLVYWRIYAPLGLKELSFILFQLLFINDFEIYSIMMQTYDKHLLSTICKYLLDHFFFHFYDNDYPITSRYR